MGYQELFELLTPQSAMKLLASIAANFEGVCQLVRRLEQVRDGRPANLVFLRPEQEVADGKD